MDEDSLRCTESHSAVDTALLLRKAVYDVIYMCTGCDSATSATSPLTSEGGGSLAKGSTAESTNVGVPQVEETCLRLRPEAAVDETVPIPFTVPSKTAQGDAEKTNWVDGFPFACPVVRDPTSSRGFYIPGEQLRLSHGTPLEDMPELTQEPALPQPTLANDTALDAEGMSTEDNDTRRISLQEAICQAPVRLSQLKDGEGDDSLYEAWLYGDPNESLRDRFARMDRGLRSKFIGLKNSSARVQEKMRQKKITTYKEVSDELVEEIGLANSRDRRSTLEAENLKRRVYDVLNVFEAVGMVTKDQKNLLWNGKAPTEFQVLKDLANTQNQLAAVLESKRSYLNYTESSYNDIMALAERNAEALQSEEAEEVEVSLPFPFFVVHGPDSNPSEVEIAQTGQEVRLAFEGETFEVSGDLKALRLLELHRPLTSSKSTFFQQLFAQEFAAGATATAPTLSPTEHFGDGNTPQLCTTETQEEMEIDTEIKNAAPAVCSAAQHSQREPTLKRSRALFTDTDDAAKCPTSSNRGKRPVLSS